MAEDAAAAAAAEHAVAAEENAPLEVTQPSEPVVAAEAQESQAEAAPVSSGVVSEEEPPVTGTEVPMVEEEPPLRSSEVFGSQADSVDAADDGDALPAAPVDEDTSAGGNMALVEAATPLSPLPTAGTADPAAAGAEDDDDPRYEDEMPDDGAPADDSVMAQKFGSRAEFLMSTIGYAVGLGNVWRFAYIVGENGGAAFLIPYVVALAFIGIPLAVVELLVGQHFRGDQIHSWLKIDKRLRGVGVAGAIVVFFVAAYYNALLAWIVLYLANIIGSFGTGELPWGGDPEGYFFTSILGASDNDMTPGAFQWPLAAALLFNWLVVYAIIFRGVSISGKVALITVTVPWLILIALMIRGVTLPGAAIGLRYLFQPNWSKLALPSVWIAAASQIFFSLAPAFGVLVTFGSFRDNKQNLVHDGVILALTNSLTSMIGAIAVFSTLGFLAEKDGVTVESIAASGPGLAFIVYPAAIREMPFSPMTWAFLFFGMLYLLGIDSSFALMEALNETIASRLPNASRPRLAAVMCSIQFVIGLWFCAGWGVHWISVLDHFVPLLALFAIGITECYAVVALVGADRSQRPALLARLYHPDTPRSQLPWIRYRLVLPPLRFVRSVKHLTGTHVPLLLMECWRFVTPALLLILLIVTFVSEIVTPYGADDTAITAFGLTIGWLSSLVPTLIIPLFVMWQPNWSVLTKRMTMFHKSDSKEVPAPEPVQPLATAVVRPNGQAADKPVGTGVAVAEGTPAQAGA